MGRTHAGNIKQWEQLTASVAANASELPQLEIPVAALAKVLEEVLAILNRQALHRANKQQSTQSLQALMAEGERLAKVLEVSLAQHYGPRSEKLAEFGLQPFRGRKRKTAAKPVPPPEGTPEPAGPSTGPSFNPAK
jgi:hypothetical protein